MATPLHALVHELLADTDLRASMGADPGGFFRAHGHGSLDGADLQELLRIVADGSAPATSSSLLRHAEEMGDDLDGLALDAAGARFADAVSATVADGTLEPLDAAEAAIDPEADLDDLSSREADLDDGDGPGDRLGDRPDHDLDHPDDLDQPDDPDRLHRDRPNGADTDDTVGDAPARPGTADRHRSDSAAEGSDLPGQIEFRLGLDDGDGDGDGDVVTDEFDDPFGIDGIDEVPSVHSDYDPPEPTVDDVDDAGDGWDDGIS